MSSEIKRTDDKFRISRKNFGKMYDYTGCSSFHTHELFITK